MGKGGSGTAPLSVMDDAQDLAGGDRSAVDLLLQGSRLAGGDAGGLPSAVGWLGPTCVEPRPQGPGRTDLQGD